MNKQTENKTIAVYGSLRFGHGNWRALLNCNPVKTEVVNIPFRMISLGSFPGLIPSTENTDITVELYEVDQETYNRIQQLEGYPNFYQKAIIATSLGELEIYVLLSPRYAVNPTFVENGDWNTYLTPRYAKA